MKWLRIFALRLDTASLVGRDIAKSARRKFTYPEIDRDAPWDWRVYGRDLMDFYHAADVAL